TSVAVPWSWKSTPVASRRANGWARRGAPPPAAPAPPPAGQPPPPPPGGAGPRPARAAPPPARAPSPRGAREAPRPTRPARGAGAEGKEMVGDDGGGVRRTHGAGRREERQGVARAGRGERRRSEHVVVREHRR